MGPGMTVTMLLNKTEFLHGEHCSIAAIQQRNQEIRQAKLYSGQESYDPATANVRYEFLPSDSSRLYQKFSRLNGLDVAQEPQVNIDNWLDPNSPNFKPQIAAAIFHYQARIEKDGRLRVCIQTEEMRTAAWKFVHQKQLVLDGTFGVCDSRVLLFIALGLDDENKGVPLAFFLFSAPSGNQATHAGYDTNVLHELLMAWRDSLGKSPNGLIFTPRVAITDTDTKERASLTLTWPDIWLLLCKFHLRQCWNNRRNKLLHIGKNVRNIVDFPKLQVEGRLKALEEK